jgi:hypothetical protein
MRKERERDWGIEGLPLFRGSEGGIVWLGGSKEMPGEGLGVAEVLAGGGGGREWIALIISGNARSF